MNEKYELPQIDFPETWLAGTDINKELLELYANYPVRLKCEICVFCAGGEVEASVNLKQIKVYANHLVVLPPGSILQINKVEGELSLYILGFSERFIRGEERQKKLLDVMFQAFERPVIALREEASKLMVDYFKLLINLFAFLDERKRDLLAPNLFTNIHTGLSLVYNDKSYDDASLTQHEQLCRTFGQLVMRHYKETRNVAWYAAKMGITHAYLCSIVKQVTGRTCMNIISSVVIMDAKSQLKQTSLSIQEICDSLNFANSSFFGKYFKRHVGISPLEYRNSF